MFRICQGPGPRAQLLAADRWAKAATDSIRLDLLECQTLGLEWRDVRKAREMSGVRETGALYFNTIYRTLVGFLFTIPYIEQFCINSLLSI